MAQSTSGYRRFGIPALLIMSLAWATTAAAADGRCRVFRDIGDAGPWVVYFEFDSAVVKPADKEKMAKLAAQAKALFVPRICVTGQADKQGNVDYNKKLSMRRAEAVATALSDGGYPAEQIHVVGIGEAFGGKLKKLVSGEDRRVKVMFAAAE